MAAQERNRRNAEQSNGSSWLEPISFQLWSFAMRNTTIYRFCASLSRFGQKISRLLGIEGTWLDPLQRWSKTRALPGIPPRSFHDWWHERNP
jgi:hypothetical protein